MPTLEAPVKPKKYEVIEYPAQKVDNLEQKRQESQAVFETLSLEDREKYYEAYAGFVLKAKALGYDVTKYDIFFDKLVNTAGTFCTDTEGGKYIEVCIDFILESNVLSIQNTLFHELIGHCLCSKNLTKLGEKSNSHTRGLHFSSWRSINYAKIDKDVINSIANKLKISRDLKSLDNTESEIVDKLSEISGIKDKIALTVALAQDYEEFSDITSDLVSTFDGEKEIGLALNEGVTEYLSINMTTDDFIERTQLLCASGYYDYVVLLNDMKEYLDNLKVDKNAWDNCLYNARLTGQPYKIIKFLKDKTGISITPKELFALDFSKILGVKTKISLTK